MLTKDRIRELGVDTERADWVALPVTSMRELDSVLELIEHAVEANR